MFQSSSKRFNKVFVVGCGLMGAGIAEVIAKANIKVIVFDVTEQALVRGREQIEKSLSKRAPESLETILSHITFTTELTDGKDCDLVIEAVPEKLHLKKEIFKKLDEVMKEDAILASNTSSLSLLLVLLQKDLNRLLGFIFLVLFRL